MKALVKKKPEKGIWMDMVAVPEVGINDVLIKIKRTAICGTDIHIYNWDEWAQKTIPVPMVVGHEYVGVVAAMGSNVTNLNIGDLVSGEGHLVCGTCRNCLAGRRHYCPNTIGVGVNRTGSFAEYLCIPRENVYLCDTTQDERLFAFFDPFGNAVHTALSFPMVGEDVLVTGAGPIGIMAAAVAKFVGARNVVITDINPYRLELAKKMGIANAINSKETSLEDVRKSLGMKEGFDVGMEMSGNRIAFNDMIANMTNGGSIALLGIQAPKTDVDWDKIVFNSLTIKGIYGREMFETWYKMASLIKSGLDIMPIVTHEFDVADYQEGFETMASGNSGKVILNWDI